MRTSPRSLLRQLDKAKTCYGVEFSEAKADLLRALDSAELPTARDVLRLHDTLCFLAAYPDNPKILRQVRRMLRSFGSRHDLMALREELVGSGVAATDTYYRFFAPTARWLAERWPDRITLDWDEFDHQGPLEDMLPLLVHYSETPGLDEYSFSVREWIERLKGPEETDAVFLVRRFAALKVDGFTWETLYNGIDPPLKLSSGSHTPNRTEAYFPPSHVCFQEGPLDRSRPDVRSAIKQPPESVELLSPRKGRRMADLARSLMVAYNRELDAFSYSSSRDVTLVKSGQGLDFAFLGMEPERRLLLEAVYGFIVLKNGMPIGYGTVSSLFGSSEIAFNIFAPFRGNETARVFVRLLAAVRHLFGSDSFTLYPYQVGKDNAEALHSGAWWFYQKLGFRAREPAVRKLMQRELRRIERNRGYRSTPATLRELAGANVYLHVGRVRDDVIGLLPLGRVGLAVSDYLAERFGGGRTSNACVGEATRLLGRNSTLGVSRGRRLAWGRWAPLVLALPGLAAWNAPDKNALAAIIDAKGSHCERDFVLLFDKHRHLRQTLRRMAAMTPEDAPVPRK